MDNNSKKNVLFVTTGTGIAPIKSMITSTVKTGRNVTLFLGLRYVADIFLEDYLKDLAAKNKNFKFNICISRPEKEYGGFIGRVTDLIEKTDFDFSNLQIYMCGNKPMVDSVKGYFLEKGVLAEDIRHEVF